MIIDLPIAPGASLQISDGSAVPSPYPTSRIQKGLRLIYDNQDLSEEAVGFGVPIVKCGLQAVFPGEVDLYLHGGCANTKISARYKLNLQERLAQNGNGSIKNSLMYRGKNSLAAIIRQIPTMRKMLTDTSNLLRSHLALQTVYETGDFSTYVVLTYTIDEAVGRIKVELAGGDFLASNITEIIVMNELGAHYFDRYQESNGTSQDGDQIGCWDTVKAPNATFIDQLHKLTFSLSQVKGAKLYRGRELIDERLAWSGFGYTFTPRLKNFSYDISIKKTT